MTLYFAPCRIHTVIWSRFRSYSSWCRIRLRSESANLRICLLHAQYTVPRLPYRQRKGKSGIFFNTRTPRTRRLKRRIHVQIDAFHGIDFPWPTRSSHDVVACPNAQNTTIPGTCNLLVLLGTQCTSSTSRVRRTTCVRYGTCTCISVPQYRSTVLPYVINVLLVACTNHSTESSYSSTES